MTCHLSLSASCFQMRWDHNTGRTERPSQPKQLLDLVHVSQKRSANKERKGQIAQKCSPTSTPWELCKQPKPKKSTLALLHLKCSCPLPLPELQLQTFKQSGTAGLQKGLQCQANSHALVFRAQTAKCETWLPQTGGRGKNSPVPPRHQHVSLLSSPEKERVQLMTRCPANDTAEALTGSPVCHQMGWGKVPLPSSLTILPCFDRHKHQTTKCTACLAVPVLLAHKKK